MELPVRLIRDLREVLRASVWKSRPRHARLPVRFESGSDGLRAVCADDDMAVIRTLPGRLPAEVVWLPSIAFDDLKLARCDVVVEQLAADRVLVRRPDVEHEYPVMDLDYPTFEDPSSFTPQGDAFLAALHEAVLTTAPEYRGRFGLTLVLFRADGWLVGTDGRHLLVDTGFYFPWDQDLLVPAIEAFGTAPFRGLPAEVGQTDRALVVRAGGWTVHLPIDRVARFPSLDPVLECLARQTTVWRLGPGEAEFLATHLPSLPHPKDTPAVTIDLGRPVSVRARDETGRGVEVVLPGSAVEGVPLRMTCDRAFLRRALCLGFGEIGFNGPATPAGCQDGRRRYVWMPFSLPPLEPSDADERVVCRV